MKLITLAFLLGLISSVAYAKDEPFVIEKPIVCSTPAEVLQSLAGPKYREEPQWGGTDDSDKYVLTVNKQSKTWTLIQFSKDIACILGSGENYHLFLLKPNT